MDQLNEDFQLSDEVDATTKKRPNFLLVLCILTFIASGFGLIMALVGLMGVNDVETTFRNASAGSDPVAQRIFDDIDIEGVQKIQTWANLLSLIASALCLFGAIVMFKMKKFGFVFYVLGQGVAVYGSFVAIGVMKKMAEIMPVAAVGDMMSIIGGATLVLSILIAIAFIIMYGLNLKHLK